MKKTYIKPEIRIFETKIENNIMAGSDYGTGEGTGSGTTSTFDARKNTYFDEEWDDEE